MELLGKLDRLALLSHVDGCKTSVRNFKGQSLVLTTDLITDDRDCYSSTGTKTEDAKDAQGPRPPMHFFIGQ